MPTLRGLGREFGLDPSTVRRYVDLGRHAEVWTVAYDRQQITTVIHEALAELLDDALEDARACTDGKERALHRQVALGAIDRVIRVHGLAAPSRVHVTGMTGPDPDLVVAVSDEVRALQARERDRAMDPARDDED